jgi:hypothetical protein
LGSLDSLGPRAVGSLVKTGNKKIVWGFDLNFGAYNVFWGPWALIGAQCWNTKTGNKKKTFGAVFGASSFLGDFLFGAPHWRTVWAPR